MNTEQRDDYTFMAEYDLERQRDNSHLNQPDSLESWLKQQTPEIGAYWKSKEGKCLACGSDIAIQDQYCPACTEFLNEVHQ